MAAAPLSPAPAEPVPRARPALALLPPTRLPLWYFGVAHLSLIVALGVVAVDPRGVSGFYYHPRMLGVVHLVTLGWITGAILGAIRIVAPLVLRVSIPVTRGDYWALSFVAIGMSGMVSHFWLATFSGMAWSAGMVVLGLVHVVTRLVVRLRSATIDRPIAAHLWLACLNLLLAGTVGVLIAIDKVTDVLPGYALSNVYAHAHLAAVGWASMMVVGIGYRLLPMVLPSAVPRGRGLYGSAILLEAGLIGLVVTLVTGWPGAPVFAFAIVIGFLVFLGQVVWMTRHRRTPPAARARPDFGAIQAGHALVYLVLAAGCGVLLVARPISASTPALAMLYGVFGMVGFLAQLVVAMELRLLPLLAWYAAFAARGFTAPDLSTHVLPAQPVAAVAFAGWVVGLPVLASGLAMDRPAWVAAGAGLLLVAVVVHTGHAVWMLRPLLQAQALASGLSADRGGDMPATGDA